MYSPRPSELLATQTTLALVLVKSAVTAISTTNTTTTTTNVTTSDGGRGKVQMAV